MDVSSFILTPWEYGRVRVVYLAWLKALVIMLCVNLRYNCTHLTNIMTTLVTVRNHLPLLERIVGA